MSERERKGELYDALTSLGSIDDTDPEAAVADMKVVRKIAARRRKIGCGADE